jgi:hypothetical protein
MTNYMASNPQTVSSARQPFGWAGGRRRGGLPACLLLVCTPAIVAQSAEFLAAAAQAQSRAFIDVQCASEVFVSQPAELVIMIGYDAAWFEAHGVSLFRQQVDVPFHLDVPWLQASPDRAVSILPAPAAAQKLQIVVLDRMVEAVRLAPIEQNGQSFARVQLQVRWLPLVAGVTTVAPVSLRFAYAEQFREHLLRGREPVDQQQAVVRSAALELRVLQLPTEPPKGWTGAVGEFQVHATSGGEELHVGESFQVELTIDGQGNRERFAKLPPPKIDGFHVQGVVERRGQGGRQFVLDVVALRPGVTEMPGVPFVAFSPAQQQFVTITSGSVPVRVLPQRDGVALAKNVQQLVDADAAAQRQGIPEWVYRWGFIALLLLGLGLLRLGRLKRGRRALGDAVHELRLALTQGHDPDRTADAYERVLAVVAGGGGFAVPSVWQDLSARGLAPDGLQLLQGLHAELDAARFGGPAPAADAVMAAVDTLVAAS